MQLLPPAYTNRRRVDGLIPYYNTVDYVASHLGNDPRRPGFVERFASLHVTHSLLAEAQDACVKVVAGDRVDETLPGHACRDTARRRYHLVQVH